MTSKQRHTQAKKYLDRQARHEKYLHQCVVCQEFGFDEKKLRERREAMYRQQIRTYYKPMTLDSTGRCEKCAARQKD